jgi:SPW repeat
MTHQTQGSEEMKTANTVRRGEDWASSVLGILAPITAWFLSPDTDRAVIGNAVVAGVVILALGVLDLEGPPHWEEPLEMVCGLWLMVSPFWLDYGGALRITHIVIGAFVVILAIIELCQDHEAIEN